MTLTWDQSEKAQGYKVHLRSLSSAMQYNFDTGPETEIRVYLPVGQQYAFTVIAYNQAGESPPADFFHFDLF